MSFPVCKAASDTTLYEGLFPLPSDGGNSTLSVNFSRWYENQMQEYR